MKTLHHKSLLVLSTPIFASLVPLLPVLLLYPMFRTCFSHCCNYTKATPSISALIISAAAMLNRWHSFGSPELPDTWGGESNRAPPVCLNLLQANTCISLVYAQCVLLVLSLCISQRLSLFADVHVQTLPALYNKWNIKATRVGVNANICLTVCSVRRSGTHNSPY